MDLGEYFGKVFSKMFHKDLYWPTLVMSIIYGIAFSILLVIGFFAFGGTALLSLSTMAGDPVAFESGLAGLVGSLIGLFAFFGVVALVLMYFIYVLYCFVIGRIASTDKNKSIGFFEGFGKSFGKGFLLLIACLIYMIVIGGIFVIIWAICAWHPVLWVIGFILSICLYLYCIVGTLVLTGKIATSESFGTSLGQAFAKPFTHFKLVGYAIIFGILITVAAFILGLLSFFPFLGLFVMLFLGTAIMVLFCLLAYYFAMEK